MDRADRPFEATGKKRRKTAKIHNNQGKFLNLKRNNLYKGSDVIVSISASPHDRTRVAVAYEESFCVGQCETPEFFNDDFSWHIIGTNLETPTWHPTQPDWFASVKNKV